MRPRSFAVFPLVLLTAIGCPPARKNDATGPAASCTRFGQTCEVSPGKLGTCVARDDCTATPAECFVCQSQH